MFEVKKGHGKKINSLVREQVGIYSTENINSKTSHKIIIGDSRCMREIAKPFLKWAGGKGQLLSQYEKFFPTCFNNYIEPFVGGGAVFFYLYSTGRLNSYKKIVLIDSNKELINCYKVIQKKVEQLILILSNGKYISVVLQIHNI